MELNSKYLTDRGFKPFAEDGELQFYSLPLEDGRGTVSLAPPSELNKRFNINNWELKIHAKGAKKSPYGTVDLTCMCSTVESLETILKTFDIPFKWDAGMDRSNAVAFVKGNCIIHPKCCACNQQFCYDGCDDNVTEELIRMVMDGTINKHNLKDYQ